MSLHLVSAFLLVLSSAQAAQLRSPSDVGTGHMHWSQRLAKAVENMELKSSLVQKSVPVASGLAKVVENMNGQMSKLGEQAQNLAMATAAEHTKRDAALTKALAHQTQAQKELTALKGSLLQKSVPLASGLAKVVENMNGQLSKLGEQAQNLAMATAAEHTKRDAVLTKALAHQAQAQKELTALKGSLVQKSVPLASGLAKVVENMNGQLSKLGEQAQNLAMATAAEHTKRDAVLTKALAHQAQARKELTALKGSLVQKSTPVASGLAKVVENMNGQLSKLGEQAQNLAMATAAEHTKRNKVLTDALAHQAQAKKELDSLK